MPKTPRMRAKDFFKYIVKYGCTEVSVKSSHHKITNNRNNRVSVVAIHTNEDIKPGLFLAILNQLRIDKNEFISFIKKD